MDERHGWNRRGFLKVLGTGLLGVPLAGCSRGTKEDPFALTKPPVPGADKWQPFQEKWISTACAQCAAGCGIRARVVGGRVVKLEGHPDNPINRGGIGPRGLSGVQVLYDPDRITGPLRRKGAKGSREWESIAWDDAIDLLSSRLRGLRSAGEPHRLGVICGRDRGLALETWERFCRAYGTPNLVDGLSRRLGALAQASFMTRGSSALPAYDWTDARYVLSIGAGILEASCQGIFFTRAAAQLRKGRSGHRTRIVQVEPTFSRTAAQGDQWIGIAPGTHAAFVLGICHVLVRDGLHDAAFVRDHAFGFEPWTDADGRAIPGFRDVLSAYAPEAVATTCEVSVRTIERVARQMGSERPAFAVTDERGTQGTNGLQVALAVNALNALLGSIDRPGGMLVQRQAPSGERPGIDPDAVALAGLAMPRLDGAGTARSPLARSVAEALPEAIAAGKPYALDTLLLHHSNPAYSGMSPDRWIRALSGIPFVVTFTPFMDETAASVADLVLPDHTYLERWEDAAPAPSVGNAVYGIRQPAVDPLHDTRQTIDVLLDVARRLGEPVAAALPWEKVEDLLATDIAALQARGRGSIVEDDVKAFKRRLLKEAFWADDAYVHEQWTEVLTTPSGRFEFFSQALWKKLSDLAAAEGRTVEQILADLGHEGDPALACLPHQAAPRWLGDAAKYPFVLEAYEPGTYAEGSGANLPLLQELVTERGQRPWHTLVEIGKEAAARLGIRAGDIVEVESPAGSVRAPASIRYGIRPDVVRIARGGGHSEFGRFARGWGVNVMGLMVPSTDSFAGASALLGTRVSLRKVTS